MGRSGSYKAKSSPPLASNVRGAGPSQSHRTSESGGAEARIAELEAQLAAAAQALQSQRSTYDEDASSFEKALSRLAQSERSLSQTKARLVDAETRARAEHTRAEALAAELAATKASASAEIAAARESASAAEAREQQALAAARTARFGEAANGAELEELQSKLSDLHAQHAELTHERTRLLGVLASLEVLAREITQLTAQAAPATAKLPEVEAWLGRDVEAKHARATVRPEGMSPPAPKVSRTHSAPELVVDGIKLEP